MAIPFPKNAPCAKQEKEDEVDDHNPLDDDQGGGYGWKPKGGDVPTRKVEDTNPIAGDGGKSEHEMDDPHPGAFLPPIEDWESGCTPCEYDASTGLTKWEWECLAYLTQAERRHLSEGAKRTTIINRRGYWSGGGYICDPRYVHPEMNDYHD